jgi:hypothetical protein
MGCRDGYNQLIREVRYDFRLVKVFVAKKVELVSSNDLIDALTQEPILLA